MVARSGRLQSESSAFAAHAWNSPCEVCQQIHLSFSCLVGWLAGWLVDWLSGSVCLLVDLQSWSVGWFGRLVGCWVAPFFVLLVEWVGFLTV